MHLLLLKHGSCFLSVCKLTAALLLQAKGAKRRAPTADDEALKKARKLNRLGAMGAGGAPSARCVALSKLQLKSILQCVQCRFLVKERVRRYFGTGRHHGLKTWVTLAHA